MLLFSIKNQRLQHIYNEEKDDLEKSFGDIKKVHDENTYRYEVLLAFWLCIHLEKLDAAKLVYNLDDIIKSVVVNLQTKGKDVLKKKKMEEEQKKKGVLGIFSSKKQ